MICREKNGRSRIKARRTNTFRYVRERGRQVHKRRRKEKIENPAHLIDISTSSQVSDGPDSLFLRLVLSLHIHTYTRRTQY